MRKSMFFVLIVIVEVLAVTVESCKTHTVRHTEPIVKIIRPQEAWVFRTVLDKKPRMLSAILNPKLWVAYNTQTGSLYKAWNGGINFEGPVYTAAHGPQPTTKGVTYFQESDSIPWRIKLNGQEITPEVVYRGHNTLNNKLTLKYTLTYKESEIIVEERPEFVDRNGKIGLERVFITSNVPDGVQVALNMHLASFASEADLESDNSFKIIEKKAENVDGRQFLDIDGQLLLKSNSQTNLTVTLTPKQESKSIEEKLIGEDAILAIMAKSDCNTCHNKDVRTVGPAYKSISEKYPNTPQNIETLIKKIIQGGAGNWGQIPMTPHPNLPEEDARTMVTYILNLEKATKGKTTTNKFMPEPTFNVSFKPLDPSSISGNEEKPGIAFNVYQFNDRIFGFPEIKPERVPNFSGTINALHLQKEEFGTFQNNFVINATGFINIQKTTKVVFRLLGDDGARLFINNQLLIESTGNLKASPQDAEIILKAGKTPFKVEYFQRGAGRTLSLQWLPYGFNEFSVVPPDLFTFRGTDIKRIQPPIAKKQATPGDGAPLQSVHPSFTLTQARPKDFKPKVGGMDFLADGRLVLSTWDSVGAVYILDGVDKKNDDEIKVKRIAFGLAEPLGLKVVDNDIYILQKQELTKLVDLNNDDIIDEYQTVCNGWKVSANFHEFAFGLVYKDGYFYGALATAINPGGASSNPQIPDRGKVVKISKQDGSFTFVASGLRTPNGIGIGVDNQIFIADNQGDWLPANKIVHLKEGAWYGSRSVDFKGTANLTETLPVVWLPQDEIANSPSQPAILNKGIYKNQMLYGDVTHGGIKRVFTEKVNNEYQGAVFRFTQGLEAGVNRLIWGPDSALYIGGIGSTGSWGQAGKFTFGLQKLSFNNASTFEMLAIRLKANGVEIEFTEPLKAGVGMDVSDYTIQQWRYKPTASYGGPKLDEEILPVKNINVSADRRKVFLELQGIQKKHVLYIRLDRNRFLSTSDKSLWATESWYTINNLSDEPF